MEAVMNHTIFKIDKTNWKPVKFGDVVAEPKEICKDIVAEGIEHVVGLEHIDKDDLHLRKSATIEESTTFSKKFRKGDVLFGRRRAYLKKAAQADFDGICSGDITVFRAKKELSAALLPFIVNNDKFFDYAVKHSAGGLSPRVKFKDLANYEFLLPPKAEQALLAELLWTMDEVIEKEENLSQKLVGLYDSASLKYFFGKERLVSKSTKYIKTEIGLIPSDWKIHAFNEVAEIIHGYQFRDQDFTEVGIPIVKIGEIGLTGELELAKCSFIDKSRLNEFENKIIRNGDILMALTGYIGRMCLVEGIKEPILQNYRVGKFVAKDSRINMDYFYHLLKSKVIQNQIISKIHVAAQGNIGKEDIEKLKIPLASMEEQEIIGNTLSKIQKRKNFVDLKIAKSQSLQKSLINQIF